VSSTYADGREAQYREMMQALEGMQRQYKGVRGALLGKVREELENLKPSPGYAPVTPIREQRCSACGRELRMTGTDGRLRCMNGHVL
jgi:hypothetical protein